MEQNEEEKLWIAGIFVVGLMMIVGIIRYIEVQKRENDPNWQIAKESYRVGNALKEVDEETAGMLKEVVRSLFEMRIKASVGRRKLRLKKQNIKGGELRRFRKAPCPDVPDATAGR